MFQRSHIQLFAGRVKEPRRLIQVLVGPRQVGKTTLMRQILNSVEIPSMYVTADETSGDVMGWLSAQWELFRAKVSGNGGGSGLLVIDEVQKLGNWSETVKRLWDEDTAEGNDIRVVLSGSSRLLLQQGLTESLAGRFEITYLPHWSFDEMHQAFGWSLDEYIWFGGYPGAADLIRDEERWKRYITDAFIETSISKDVLMLTRVDKPVILRRLFEIGCFYCGQELSFNKILGQHLEAGNTTTLAHYLDLLDTAGLLGGLEKYSGGNVRKRSSSPKFVVHNTALFSSLRPFYFEEVKRDPVLWGRAVEAAIGAHLINHALADRYQLHYWRVGNYEVDFVIEHRGRILGVEVKSSSIRDVRGISKFKEEFPHAKVIIVAKGAIPPEEFLKNSPLSYL